MTSCRGSSSSDNHTTLSNDSPIALWRREYDAYSARYAPPTSRPPLPHTDSSDSKRRLTATEEGRTYPYGAVSIAGSSTDDLTASPMRRRRASAATHSIISGHSAPRRRRESAMSSSDIVPPPWQPDSVVTKCPVCEQDFSWMFRKHHCRKCGRVVCGDCSPHVITIPSEYIVRAPRETRQLHGAEQVRVCKPCVPDPWTPPTAPSPQQTQRQTLGPSPEPAQPTPFRRPSESSQRRYHHRQPPPSMLPHQSPADNSRFPSHYDFMHPTSSSHREPSRVSSIPQTLARPRGLTAPGRQNPNNETPAPPRNPIPRRRVKEEDECPVCGIEMAPGEAAREQHISDCISTRMHKPTASSIPAPAQPTNRHDANLPSSSSSSLPHPSTPPIGSRARANSSAYRSRGMINYTASEKDCVDEEGNEQECTICMEEFVQGVEMGRLECWCKFHRHCIREWWGRKGAGSCPVHVVSYEDDGGNG